MSSTLTEKTPLVALDDEFPNELWITHQPLTKRYGCCCDNGLHGLAVFEDKTNAQLFCDGLGLPAVFVHGPLSFDQAREIAQSRPPIIRVLYLLDDFWHPKVHYVR